MFDASENDLRFAIQHALGPEIHKLVSEIHDISNDTVDVVLSEAAKFARDVIAPLNHLGDKEGCKWQADNTVKQVGVQSKAVKSLVVKIYQK